MTFYGYIYAVSLPNRAETSGMIMYIYIYIYGYIYIYLDFSKPAPTQKSHSETFAGNITAVPVNYGLATRHQRESLLTFPHINWEFGYAVCSIVRDRMHLDLPESKQLWLHFS